ncbi:hypothetical protein PAHAL_4G216400 [Panicum hallii]|uniref:Uncharacterized protein n=1 Tax=Panicum hallii TaxID=206008 RepID=A0A2T8JDL0_9POAL|nr:hypothetical protein PAHAL_4G216400 [Panicum hallii]
MHGTLPAALPPNRKIGTPPQIKNPRGWRAAQRRPAAAVLLPASAPQSQSCRARGRPAAGGWLRPGGLED